MRPKAGVSIRDISEAMSGFSLSGPRSRELLATLTPNDVSNDGLGFMACQAMDVGMLRAKVGRISVSGELGYEINVPLSEHLALYRALVEAGRDFGLAQIGFNALNSLRTEKSFGIWSAEFTWAYTAGMSGLDRFVAFDKADFIGRDAALREREAAPPTQRLVSLEIDADNADASGFEPLWIGDRRVGFITSGAYGHVVGKSLAMAYLDTDVIDDADGLAVHIVGALRPATILKQPAFDPTGARMRA